MRRSLGVLVCLGFLVALLPGSAQAADVVRKDIVVSTRAGGTLEAAFFRPDPAPAGTLPVVVFPHGGGGRRDCPGDVASAERYARRGYVTIVYTARGHGLFPPGPLSDCERDYRFDPQSSMYDVFGPFTISDLYDVINAVVEDPDSHADRKRVGLKGYSQGGGTTNLGIAWGDGRKVTDLKPGSQPIEPNPYGIQVTAAGPGHTFYDLYRSLAPNECFKLSFGTLILGVYYSSNGAVIDPWWWARWGGAFLSGEQAPRDLMRPDFELRSPKTYAEELDRVPSLWVQAFDDLLFPVDEAVDAFDARKGSDRLWLSWGGHAAPASNVSKTEATAREAEWESWFDRYLKGENNGADRGPRVTFWVPRPGDPADQIRMTAPKWPPPQAKERTFYFSSGSRLAAKPDEGGEDRLVNDGSVQSLSADPIIAALPMGGELPPGARTPANTAVFTSEEFARDAIVAGAPSLDVRWTSSGSQFEVATLLWDVYPDGSRTLVTRGCTLLPNNPGEARKVSLDLFHTARVIGKGHRLELWVSPIDQPTFLASHVPSVNVLSYSKAEPSRLTIPMMPAH